MGWDDSDEDDWENPSPFSANQNQPKKWSDEEDSEDEAPKEKSAKSLPPTEGSGKKKRSLKQILKEREAKDAARRAEIAALEEEIDDKELTKEERKARELKQIVEADLKNAEDLFEDTEIVDKAKGQDEDDPLYIKPTGPKELKLHGDALIKHLGSLQKVKGFTVFFERVLKYVATELSIDDINSLSSILKVLANSKQQEQRKKDGKKKSKKPSLQAAQSTVDDGTSYDDYDLFM